MGRKKKVQSYKENLKKRSDEARIVRRIVAIIIVALILIISIGGYATYRYIDDALQPVDIDSQEKVNIHIDMGSSVSDIAAILEDKGIISDSKIFRFYVKFKNESGFQAGDYVFSPSNSIDDIIKVLKSGKIIEEPVFTVTIPEGKTIEEIASMYASELPFTKEEFLDKVNDEKYIKKLMDSYPKLLTDDILDADIRTPLEGYLFAATYNLYKDSPSIDTIVRKMLDKTKDVITPYMNDIESSDFTIHQTLTMASLVQNEAKNDKQRNMIAGIFYNRMDDGMKLKTDPTVLYALGEHKDRVLLEDLEIESPYNTYFVDGLPVGPISNFSKSSLSAVIDPTESDYLFFLHDSEGNIHYAETGQEHMNNKNKYIEDEEEE